METNSPSYKIIGGIIVVILVVALVVILFVNNNPNTNTTVTNSTQTTPNSTTPVSSTNSAAASVNIIDMEFSSSTITIKKGTTVTWTNKDSTIHTIVADSGEFQSSVLTNGDNFTYTFENTGTYNYHCGIHSTMTGKIVVE